MSDIRNVFEMKSNYLSFAQKDRNRTRKVVFYGRVSTEHEAQISALENQIEWYDDQARMHKNWLVLDKYIDEGITGTQAKKRPSFLRMLEDARERKFDLIVTREVCRFARNTVDTLVVTRELKNLGIEVYFVEDNIWTMDGDGELRLTIMATLAQEESRKVSERVKAGQHISREKGTIYGNGNILGYDRVGHEYVINKEQAETVRMIFDLYLQGELGANRIAEEMIKRGRLTATGTDKWTHSIINRILKNPTYMGYMAYGKSFSNNYLEQKRINNHNEDTYLYRKADFEPIVTEEEFKKAMEIRNRRTLVLPGTIRTNGFGEDVPRKVCHRDSSDIWCQKLRCSCGSSFRKTGWYKKEGKPRMFGYQCYNVVNYVAAKKKMKGRVADGLCDMGMVIGWKIDFMAREVFKEVWGDRSAEINEACDIIRKCSALKASQDEKELELNRKLARIQGKLKNLRDMRIEGDIETDEFRDRMKRFMDEEEAVKAEIAKLSDRIEQEEEDAGPDLDAIRAALESMVDFSGVRPDEELLKLFVARVVVEATDHFVWYLNFSGRDITDALDVVAGKKSKSSITLSAKGAGRKAIRLSDLKRITDLSDAGVGSEEDKKLKKQLAASDKAFKIHFTKTLDANTAREYCELAGKRFFRNRYKELKLDIYIF
ncbi:MAG: recombinase family protein [Lachnospiraceae bacterium]|nr:recombinase family protein [Lachnospiraceae bacterium]